MGKSRPGKETNTGGTSRSGEDSFEDAREQIFQVMYDEYNDDKDGLIRMSREAEASFRKLGAPKRVSVLRPKKKINVLLVGNHSAGKSSFINWYIGEELMKSGVAIETKAITLVVQGRRRESFKGPASLRLHPHLEELSKMDGIMDHLCTEVSAARSRQFGAVCLVDTPGLVDGAFKYPFDVNKGLVWLAKNAADIIFVLLDPQGQALCARTMNVIQEMDKICPEKMHFFLSKADTVENEHDRQRVLIQITQGLSQRIENKNFDIIPFYVPIPGKNDGCAVPNKVNEACRLTDRAINSMLQANLHRMEKDAVTLSDDVDEIIDLDNENRASNRVTMATALAFMSLALVPLAILVTFAVNLGRPMFTWLPQAYLDFAATIVVPEEWRHYFVGIMLALVIGVWLYAKFAFKLKPTLTRKEITRFKKHHARLGTRIPRVTKELYKKYFEAAMTEEWEDEN